jgi:hypothetical protein
LHFEADMTFNSESTPCTAGLLAHFNVATDAMQALFANERKGRPACFGIKSLAPLVLQQSTAGGSAPPPPSPGGGGDGGDLM